MKIPASTYRLQIRPEFTLDDAARLVPYLASLGVNWLYLSPLLESVGASEHGYDVSDPSRVDRERGGREALERVAAAAHGAGMGILVDIVPNHLGVEVPEETPWWWDLLREGRGSRYAEAFDVDWDAGDGKVLLPVLGSAEDLGLLKVEGERLWYYEHSYPLAPGTYADGDSAEAVHERQHYRLVPWREADDRLNYRRFFAVNTLAGVRVEVPWVFEESHAEVRRWLEAGLVDGLRIDHPDGLRDPAEYLERLRELSGGAYTLVEKILEPGEALPADFPCEGTTGYDALGLVDRVLVDPAGEEPLTALDTGLRGEAADYAEMIHGTKRWMADGLLHAEILRLARLAAAPAAGGGVGGSEAESEPLDVLADALAEIAAHFPVYRTYFRDMTAQDGDVTPQQGGGEHDAAVLAEACRAAAAQRPELAATIGALEPRLADPSEELCRRFQQTTGMIMAKAVEDTAFYRYSRLGTLTEVGGDPTAFALAPAAFHAELAERERHLGHSMTTLTTHDTKRSEDTRARITVLAELADEWAQVLPRLLKAAPLEDGPLANLLWQAILGAWPAEEDRLVQYAEKAAREAGVHTLWTDPDEAFEDAVRRLVHAAVDPASGAHTAISAYAERVAPFGASNALSAKLIQLAMPGVPDVYQGTEFWDRSLCDPDNRRTVDFAARAEALAALDAGMPVLGPLAEEAKLLVVSRTLRLRRDRPELFAGYAPVEAEGPAAEHLVGFRRGERGVTALATRLPAGLERDGGWGTTTVRLARAARDAFTGRSFGPGDVLVGEVLGTLPVALLVPEEEDHHA
ncbi:Malto-oligosyltrehalose synthase [Sinomonas atrocyanea]|uniref:Malto-oligosyltrehalose synthase n=1 Tax=Sinomonas atrocyanea TaxID=37927 RepID=A0A127A3Y2_9MICC|nr:malto-oligosyltrehalose synthase [Sinomonas atrocyanea]AMM33494.1 Malto-oligosyltrehalose synthase [Sinomonas atrocyanea]GEB62936.1 malto-oligosyltrehalose synthase [Sinomonas atrocyanea]